jgi:hypothetical protein
MLALTKELRKTTAAQARAYKRLQQKTLKAALHLQALLDGEPVQENGRTYRAIHVSWPVRQGAAVKSHPQGGEALAGRGVPGEAWTLCYDPRRELREIDTQTIWEVVQDADLQDDQENVVFLPSAESLLRFAADYPLLVKARTAAAKAALAQLDLALKELEHAQTS